MARIVWKQNGLVSLKLREDLYTIGQMLASPAMRFYDIRSADGKWSDVDLNQKTPLFRVFIGNVVFHELTDRKITEKSVGPSNLPDSGLWIKPHLSTVAGFPFRGGKLIDIGVEGKIGTSVAPTIKENLDAKEDFDVIVSTELTNMWGADDLRERLIHYFDHGFDRNVLKEKVFPELAGNR